MIYRAKKNSFWVEWPQSIITDCKSNALKARDPRSVASIVDQTENQELPRDCDDSQLDGSFQDERQPFPSVSYSVSSIENKTQQEKGKITNRLASKLMVVTNDSLFVWVPSNPDTIRDIPKHLSSSSVIHLLLSLLTKPRIEKCQAMGTIASYTLA